MRRAAHARGSAAAIACVLAAAAVVVARGDLNVAAQWERSTLRLPAPAGGNVTAAAYVPDNNLVYRVRVWAGTVYVAVPRFRAAGVPATLCATSARDGGPLRPFPTAGLQAAGNCFALQNAVDIEVDHLGQLWTLDRGRPACDPKLFVVATGTGHVVRSAVMPPAVYTARSVLTGLALDLKTLTAVVADVGPDDPGFIAYDFRSGVYRKFRCTALVQRRPAPAPASEADVDEYDEAMLAASPIDDQLYFTAIRLDAVYAIPLSVFAAPPLSGRDVSHYVSARGPLNGTATAAVMDAAGNLYLAMRAGHKVMTQ